MGAQLWEYTKKHWTYLKGWIVWKLYHNYLFLKKKKRLYNGFPHDFAVKSPPVNPGNPGDVGLILESGRSPGAGNGNPLQYSCLENSSDRGVWWATVFGVAKNWTQRSPHEHTKGIGNLSRLIELIKEHRVSPRFAQSWTQTGSKAISGLPQIVSFWRQIR